MEHLPQFKQSLLKLAQAGTLVEIIGARPGRPAQLAFHLEYVCHVHVTLFHEPQDFKANAYYEN